MLKKITSKLDLHTLEVLVKSSKTMIVKVFGMITSLLISIFLARNLGSEGLGVVNFANKLGMIILIFTMFGFQNVIIKFIAIAKGKLDNKGIATTVKTSLFFNSLLSIALASAGAIVLPYVLDMWLGNQDLYIPLLIVFIMLIPQTISRVYASALNGYGKIWQANLVNQTLSILIVGMGLLLYNNLNIKLTVISVLLLYAVSRFLLVFIVLVLWSQTFKSKIKGQFNFKPMFKMAKPMLLVTGAGVIASNIDVIMLGVLSTFKEVGIYSVAVRLSLLISLLLQVSNSAISPKIAHLFNESKINEIQDMVQSVTKLLALISFLFLSLFVFLGQWLLGFWGAEFQEAYWILVILAIGQFFNMATGCAGALLSMCGFEKILGHISLATVILNITLNFLLITNYGALGAATATAVTITLSNVVKVIFAKRKTGVLTLPIF
jgi:O-antigen/teichoic acid export membrane protein